MRTAEWTDTVSVLDRLTAVLEAFDRSDEGLGVSELARRANLPKSTVSRIATQLVDQRLLDREGAKLFLGVRLFELGQTVEQPRHLRRLALPVIDDLRNMTGRTVHLAMLEQDHIVIVAVARALHSSLPTARVGDRLPAVGTILGRAMRAAQEHATDGCETGDDDIACAVFGHGGAPVAAISLSGVDAAEAARVHGTLRAAAMTLGRRLKAGRTP